MTIRLRDTIRFRDSDGTIRYGYVCGVPDHTSPDYRVSVACYQGLVSVRPSAIQTTRDDYHRQPSR